MDEYIVYVQIDENNNIVAINSSEFIPDTTDWIEIDKGYGDRFHHAQGNYLDGGLITSEGICRYQLVEGKAILRPGLNEAIAAAQVEQEKQMLIATLKRNLADTDYAVIKIAEGVATPEEYADIITQRQAWRAEINTLEVE